MGQAELRARQQDLAPLLAKVPRQVRRRPRALLVGQAQEARTSGTSNYAVHHLPDASRDRPRRAGRLPEMGHDAGTHGRSERRRRAQPRVGRLQAEVLDRCRFDRTSAGTGHGAVSRSGHCATRGTWRVHSAMGQSASTSSPAWRGMGRSGGSCSRLEIKTSSR